MARQTIYTVGGTVQAGGGVYIKRKADDELLELCKQGEFAFILSSRQVGKSSLMVHTAQELAADNICSVIIDLSALGTSITQEEWYLGILNEIQSSLNLEADIFGWWQQYSQLGPAQRLTNFFKDILLTEVKEQVVLFFDEIDSTLSIPFSDDFYVALRAVYNARSTTPDFKRLSFVLVGVAAPSDLISDSRRTPFNIGRRVEIKDFTLAEALPLAQGLGQQAEKVLAWVLQYTGGHPYLTQRLCADLANSKQAIDEQTVANAVERLFTGEQGKQDNNLQFVRDMLSKRSPDVAKVLSIYRDVRSGKNVADDERSITKAHLKLSGLVRSEQGFLRVRNEIYNSVFNLQWVRENTPKNWQRTALIALSAILGLLVLGTLGIFINDFVVGSRIDRHYRSFFSPSSPPEQRLSDLAEIYRQTGILSHKDSNLTASQLFYGLSSAEEQRALFGINNIQRFPTLENDLVIVISHLYITVANVDPEEDNTELLQAMLNALSNFPNNSIAASLKDEITAWIAGRQSFQNGDLDGALANYNNALSLNTGNQAVLYERAKVYVAREEYTSALKDLEATISAAKKTAPDIATATPTESPVPVLATETLNSPALQVNETSIPQTSLPTQNSSPATEVLTPTLELTPTFTIEATATAANISPKKYESNFTTVIEVINAVRGVINNTPQLQLAIQSSDLREYINLSGYGLISNLPSQLGSSVYSQPPADGRAWGIDVGSFNKNIDWEKVKNAGIDFVFIRASQADFTDPLFDSHWADAGQAGILRGAYHFIDPTVDCTTQAETFLSKVKLEPGDLPPVLDLELATAIQNAQGTQTPILNSQIISCAETWLKKVEAETGRKPIIYSGASFLNERVSESNGQPPSWAMDYTLWIASYLTHDLQAKDEPAQPQGWPNWSFWQYSSKGLVDGVLNDDGSQPQGVDLNIFNGPLDELQTFLANSSLAQVSTAEPPNMTKVAVPADPYRLYATEDDLALRAEPSVTGFLWKRLVIGTELICLEPKATAQAKLGVNGQWIQVQDPSGDQGYVAAWFVSDNKGLPAVTPTANAAGTPPSLYVDTNYTGSEDGSVIRPFNTLNEGMSYARSLATGALIYVKQADGTWLLYGYVSPINPGVSGGS